MCAKQLISGCVFGSILTGGAATLSAQNGTLIGTLIDIENGAPLVSADVEVLGSGGTTTLTSASGQFTISLAPGTYSLVISTLGYRDHREDGVRIRAGATTTLDLQLTSEALELNPIVVTASRAPEKNTEAPATTFVVGVTEVAERAVVTPVDHLRAVPGVDIIQHGAQSTNIVVRGFNNIFSGALHTLVDNRIAGVPSLRVNLLHWIPTTNDDLDRIEVVLGPGSALYGPNTANGVVHMITKSPLESQGTSVTLGGGEKNTWQGAFRTAHKLSDNFGFKVSAQQIQGNEWRFTDPAEVAARATAIADQTAFVSERIARGLSQEEADFAFDRVGIRDYDGFDFRRQSVDVRADYGFADDGRLSLDLGLTNAEGVELTGLGAGQVEDWKYAFYQARVNVGRLFAQAYVNTTDAGDSYLLRDGAPLVDRSRMFVGQIQHGGDLLDGRQDFTYGIDYFFTNPRTEGTINGRNEADDNIEEFGAYIQSKTALTDQLDLVLAGRLDTHSRLDDNVFSPRAALVFEPAENQSFRATFNRAFSTPSTLNLFLDISGGPAGKLGPLGYRAQAQGPTQGIVFQNPDGSLADMRSPFNPGGPGLIPADVPTLWQLGVGVLAAQGVPAAALLATLSPTAADTGINLLDPNTSEVAPLTAGAVPSVERLKESTTTTLEVGYQGLIDNRIVVGADVWYSKREDFVSPLVFRTPLLLLDGSSMVGFLVPPLTAALVAGGLDPATAQATAIVQATALADGGDGVGGIPGLAEIPLGVVSSDQVEGSAPNLLVTYVNAGDVDMYGADFSIRAFLDDKWTLSGTASFVSDDYFDLGGDPDTILDPPEVEGGIEPIALNAPKAKGAVSLAYRDARVGFNAEARLRITSGFPAESAGFVGTFPCETETRGILFEETCVEGFQLVDLTLGYKVPQTRATLQLTVSNLFDSAYRSFVGVPEIGRFIMVRVRYDLF